MAKPLIFALDGEVEDLRITSRLLYNRYAVDYEVMCTESPAAAFEHLQARHHRGDPVAVLLAAQQLPEMTGVDFLARVHRLYPDAKRVLLFDRGDLLTLQACQQAVALGRSEYFIVKPSGEPDEAFHQLITDLLSEWTEIHQETFVMLEIVGEQWDSQSHAFRDLLERNGIPYRFHDTESAAGQALLQQVQRPEGPFPVARVYTGAVLTNPSPPEVAAALGANARPPQGIYDLTIVGGGPAGLSAAVYAASEGLRTLVVEREALGGQAGTSSRIRNYLGFPRGISGGDLAQRAANQATLFGTEFYLLRDVTGLQPNGRGYELTLSDGLAVQTRTVLLTMGVTYRRLNIPALEALSGAGVFYGAALAEAQAMEGEPVYVVGGGNSAGQAAIHLSRYASAVTLLVRGGSLADSMSDYLIQEIHNRENIHVRLHTQVVDGWGDDRLEGVVLHDGQSGASEQASAAGLFILIGAEPHTAWLPPSVQRDDQGYVLTGTDLLQPDTPPAAWSLPRLPHSLETSLPGVFAAGDVRHRALKRVASAVGEGSMAVHFVHQVLGEQ